MGRKILTGIGWVLIWELVRYVANNLLFMFLGPFWVLLISTLFFAVIASKIIASRRYSRGDLRRAYCDSSDKEVENGALKDVFKYTDVKTDVIAAIFVLLLAALYLAFYPNIFEFENSGVRTVFVLSCWIVSFVFFVVIDVVIWLRVHKNWIHDRKRLLNDVNKL